jgi:eukaryotic-like serine/threonine-protein kinase
VAVYDVGVTATGAMYIVTDHSPGTSLQKLLQHEVLLHEERALGIFIQIAEALAYAHGSGRTHRNLKPGNVLLGRVPGCADIVKISDFGIARSMGEHRTSTQATINQIAEMVANPNYMSPEQCVADELDERTDIYSLGCIMYEAVTGYPPFRYNSVIRVMLKHLSEAPRFPSDTLVTPGLKHIIMRCLEKDRALRYQTAEGLLVDLQNLYDGKSSRHVYAVSSSSFSSLFRSLLFSLRTSFLSPQKKRVC